MLTNSGQKMIREKPTWEMRYRVKDNLKMCFKEIDYENVN
jgi:hypothetical protein